MRSEFALTTADLHKFRTWEEGFNAYDEDKCLDDCPYTNHKQAQTWEDGWMAAWRVDRMDFNVPLPKAA